MIKKVAKLNKNLILFICLATACLSLITGVTYAYFSNHAEDTKTISTIITAEENVCEVSSFEELYYASSNDVFNDSQKTSTERKIIRLTNDIALVNNLILNEDAHIDLNGKILTIGSYTLSIIHSYAGSFMIYNGTLKFDTDGRIVVNTTIASYLTENITFEDMSGSTISDSTEYVKVVAIDDKYTVYNALYSISSSLISDIYYRPKFLTYEEFNVLSLESFDESLFLPSTGLYIFRDVELLSHYLSNDIEIAYTSSAPTVLSEKGNVNGTGDVTLSINLSSFAFTDTYSCNFTIHVVEDTSLDAGEAMIKSHLADIYVSDTLKITDDITHEGYYSFTNGRELPPTSNDANITYSYKTFADNACTTEVATVSGEENGVFVFEPNNNCYYLQITIKNTNNETKTIVLNMYSTYIAKNETAARLILNELYGGSLIYNTSEGPTKLYTYDEILENASERVKQNAANYGLTAVSYEITSGSDAETDYKIENNELDIIVATPTKMKESSVTATFTFEGGVTADIELYVVYITTSSDTTNNFLPYYTIYDNNVTSDASLDTFTMPLAYENNAPYTMYDFSYVGKYVKEVDSETSTTTYKDLTLSKPSALVVKLCESDGTLLNDFTSSYSDGTSITNAFDNYLGSTTLSNFVTAHPGAYWELSFDNSKISKDDMEAVIIYNYRFGDSSSSTWTPYQKLVENDDGSTTKVYTDLTTSTFTINGGLIYSTDTTLENSIRNASLFIELYNKLNTNNETITTSSASDKVILNDWFDFSIEVDTSTIPLSGDIDINGIQYLSSCTSLKLSGITMDESKISLISTLNNVETLDISSASITDGTMLVSLKNMKKLKALYINDNSISTFDFLNDFTSLSEVYLYNNTVTSTYYGSTGMCNYQAYEDLLRKGVAVYYTINESSIPMAFENNTDLNDYQRLKSIAYQSVLKNGLSITILYEKFVDLTATDFLLEDFGKPTWSYGGGTDDTDATYFQATATCTSDSSITLIVKYYIDRY